MSKTEAVSVGLPLVALGMLLLGMLWGTMPDEVKKAEEPKETAQSKVVMTEADKDWIDTQIGWELEKRGLHVFVIGTWMPDKEAHVMRMTKIGVKGRGRRDP